MTQTYDAIVIGAGVMGASIAFHLAERGLKVAILSGARPRIALSGNGEGLILSPGAPAGALLEVVSRRRGVAELATVLLDAQDAHALLISVSLPGTADAGPLGRVAAPGANTCSKP